MGNQGSPLEGSPSITLLEVGTSTFSEYTVVHAGCLAKVKPEVPLDKVCVLSCGISTGFGAAVNVAKPKKGQTVAVFGLGAVGLAAAEGARFAGASRIIGVDLNPNRFEEGRRGCARFAGASRIIGVDLNPNRFEEAKKFGCTEFLNPNDYDRPIQEVIAEMTNGGVNKVLSALGILGVVELG